MRLCKFCREKLQTSPAARLCTECRLLTWPSVRERLTACLEERLLHQGLQSWCDQQKHTAAAWQAYFTACSSERGLPASATSIEHQRAAQRAWQAERLGGERYAALIASVEPLLETQGFFFTAVHMRRDYRRYLRLRFGFEVRRGVWLSRKRPPKDSMEAAYLTNATLFYDFWTRIFLAGIDAIDVTQHDDPAPFARAADAMRMVLLEGVVDVVMSNLDSPYEFQREGAVLSLAGKTRLGISLRQSHSLRKALGEAGNPYIRLDVILPEYVQNTYSGRAQNFQGLAKTVRTKIGQLRQKPPSPRKRRAQEEAPSLAEDETVSAQWEARQQLADLAARAPLSPQERAMFDLRYIRGMKYREIAAIQQCSLNTVRKTLYRIKTKLAQVDHS